FQPVADTAAPPGAEPQEVHVPLHPPLSNDTLSLHNGISKTLTAPHRTAQCPCRAVRCRARAVPPRARRIVPRAAAVAGQCGAGAGPPR
ncbi:hypothetical protein, partial [Nocardia carnea]|uniref:hypothetical protein n=1 Tax=Nocardia carnea TaxID=37328 RepID=UPI002455F325